MTSARSRRIAVVLIGVALLVALGGSALYVVRPLPSLFAEAEAALGRGVAEADQSDLAAARAALVSVRERLDSPAARILGVVPVASANVDAVSRITDTGLGTLDAASELTSQVAELEDEGIVRDGRVRIGALRSLEEPLARQVRALDEMRDSIVQARSGWLLPPLWDRVEELRIHTEEAHTAATRLHHAVRVAPEMLGENGRKTHLVLLMNNAELRGAGGVITGVGALNVRNGRMSLGRFSSVHELREEPPRKVPAPEDFVRRYGQNRADTTLWLNTSFSPHVPHVAEVAQRLFQRTAGTATDGVLAVDPRGLQALLAEEAELEVPGRASLPASRLADHVYSDAYERFADQTDRYASIIALGQQVFQRFLEGPIDRARLEQLGEAAAGGHIRFVAPPPGDGSAVPLGAEGDIRLGADELGFMVAAQNLGSGNEGTKLDHWARRRIDLRCRIDDDATAACRASVVIRNRAPRGLTRYVAGRPYGLLRNYAEVLVPERARVTGVDVDGEPAPFTPEPYVGWMSLGVELEIPRGQERELTVAFRAPVGESSARVVVIPQPLTRDARLDLRIDVPDDWVAERDRMEFQVDRFDRTIEVEARRAERTGIPAVWERLVRFWREPVL